MTDSNALDIHGRPCWYELGTSDLDAARDFYGQVFHWTVTDPGTPGFDYRVATAPSGGGVAGMMSLDAMDGDGTTPPPHWLLYLAVDDADTTAAKIRDLGGSVVKEPADIPGTGRFAVCTDPQGAYFGLLQPMPMDNPPEQSAFDQSKLGHGNWHELQTTDPGAALRFYQDVFGWTAGDAMDMGDMGTYQLIGYRGTDMGGIFAMMGAPQPAWTSYFMVDSTDAAIGRIQGAGGTIVSGPQEVPGGAYVAVVTDPQGAVFAVVGDE